MPFPSALSPVQGAAVPGAPLEPVLDVLDIQGNILVGFNTDHQSFLFIKIVDVPAAKRWLASIVSDISNTDEVLAFRRLFRAMRDRRAREAIHTTGTWLNVAFTWTGIEKLTSAEEASKFQSIAFSLGMDKRAGFLGDPVGADAEPLNWVVGASDSSVDMLLIVAGDDDLAVQDEVARLTSDVAKPSEPVSSPAAQSGLRLVYQEDGADLPDSLSGHEHFGFKDGVSQPGIRGRVSDGPLDFLTPRLIDPTDPRAKTHARPGQPLIWPGQVVLGDQYPLQDESRPVEPKPATPPSPGWAANGSFLVFRRLRQDVAAFWKFMRDQAKILSQKDARLKDLTDIQLASMMVGRWPDGTPIMREPLAQHPMLMDHPFAGNNFQFTNPTPTVTMLPEAGPPDTFSPAPADDDGIRCPYASHIRKVNPRDDTTDLGSARRSLPKRIVRRGIPFGKPLANPRRPGRDQGNRGLLFVSYQTSIEEQFEFLTTDWTNSEVKPRDYPAAVPPRPAGQDPLIGQNGELGESRARSFVLRLDEETFFSIDLTTEWVIPTGGGYFFAPSISAIRDVLSVSS